MHHGNESMRVMREKCVLKKLYIFFGKWSNAMWRTHYVAKTGLHMQIHRYFHFNCSQSSDSSNTDKQSSSRHFERQNSSTRTLLENNSTHCHFISTSNQAINRLPGTQQPRHLHPPWGSSLHLFHPEATVHHFYNFLLLSNCHHVGFFFS